MNIRSKKMGKTNVMAVLLTLVATQVLAAELQTQWIEPVEGFHEDILGVEITAVEPVAAQEGVPEGTQVKIMVPKAMLGDRDDIQEIIVIGKKPEEDKKPQVTIPHKWVADYDKDNYGLVVYLGKDGKLPFRLYFNIPEGQ
jgi:hypothetical protein